MSFIMLPNDEIRDYSLIIRSACSSEEKDIHPPSGAQNERTHMQVYICTQSILSLYTI